MQVVILREKYGDRYFVAKTKEQLHKTALKILTERWHNGRWYFEPEKVEALDFTEADIPKIPESMRAEAEKALKQNQALLRHYADAVDKYEAIRKAVEENDGKAALRILESRSKYEYEEIMIEVCEEVD
jgi:hypothetical protein